jgi:hypothetical protein
METEEEEMKEWIKTDFKDIGSEGGRWIKLVLYHVQW